MASWSYRSPRYHGNLPRGAPVHTATIPRPPDNASEEPETAPYPHCRSLSLATFDNSPITSPWVFEYQPVR